jgi:hypothetical protein
MSVHAHSRVPRRAYRTHPAAQETAAANAQATPLSAPRVQALETLFIVGFAGVFVVNGVVAVLEPSEFTALVERSVVGRSAEVMSGRWIAWVIAVHDFALGALLLATVRVARPRPFVLAWAGAWLLAVSAVKLTALEALGG